LTIETNKLTIKQFSHIRVCTCKEGDWKMQDGHCKTGQRLTDGHWLLACWTLADGYFWQPPPPKPINIFNDETKQRHAVISNLQKRTRKLNEV